MNKLITTHKQLNLAIPADPWDAARIAWLDAKENRTKSKHTRRAYEKTINDWLAFLADIDRHPSKAGGVEINTFAQQLASEGKQPATVKQRLAAISSFYSYCQHKFTLQTEQGEITLINYNPVDRAERPKVNPFEGAQKIRPNELPALIAAPDVSTIQGSRDYSLLLTFVFTGRRLAELARLVYGDLYFTDNQVSYSYVGKGNKANTRRLPPPAWKAIRNYLSKSKRLGSMTDTSPLWIAHSSAAKYFEHFEAREGERPLSVAMIRRLVNRYTLKSLGRKVSPHALRHAAAMVREQSGDDIRTIQKFLDHSSLEMTDRYLSSMRIDKDDSWQAVAELLEVKY